VIEEPAIEEPVPLETAEVGPPDLLPRDEPMESLTVEETSTSPVVEAPKVIPPAPWQMASSSTPEPPSPVEYASAWESPPPKPTPEGPSPEETILTSAPAPVAPPPPPPKPAPPKPPRQINAPRQATVPPSGKRPPSAAAPRPVAPRMPPPKPRGGSNAPMIVGGLVALAIVAGGGYWLMRPGPAPAPPPPTPRPTPVAVATPPPATPEPTIEGADMAAVEPTPEAAPPPAIEETPAPAGAATPTPRTAATPRATPTPAPTRAAAAPTPPPAPTVAAPVSQAPRLMEEANAAIAASDLPRASQLLDQVLKIEPGNAAATARKAEVAARLATLGKKFSIGRTTVLGGKTAKGPTGFDLGGGGVVQTEFSAQIRCTTTPAAVEPGANYSITCSILNIGSKPFRIANVAVNETTDAAKSTGAGTAPRGDIAPQSEQTILQKSGSWVAQSQWSIEIVAKSNKDESFRAVYSWR